MENKRQRLAFDAYKVASEELGHEVGNSRVSLNYDFDITPTGVMVSAFPSTDNCSYLELLTAIVYILEDFGFFKKGNEHWSPVLIMLIDAIKEAYKFKTVREETKKCGKTERSCRRPQ